MKEKKSDMQIADAIILDIKDLMARVYAQKKVDEQWFLDFLDQLNQLSVMY